MKNAAWSINPSWQGKRLVLFFNISSYLINPAYTRIGIILSMSAILSTEWKKACPQ
jgi:hypothetical protein